MDEDLISPIEFSSCYETDEMYIVYPPQDAEYIYLAEKNLSIYKKVEINDDFNYSTLNNVPLNKEEINKILDNLELE